MHLKFTIYKRKVAYQPKGVYIIILNLSIKIQIIA